MLTRRMRGLAVNAMAALLLGSLSERPAQAQSLVKVTPLGSHAGELCARDRAILFEDPTGVRILYDPGFMVDEMDPRLGEVHVILLSHAHSDHIGTRRDRGGTCAAPAMGAANSNSNVASIAAVKNSVMMTATETATFLGLKVQGIRGAVTSACATAGLDDETTVPMGSPCTAAIGVSGSRTVRRGGASGSVRITGVQATHPNNIPAELFDAPGLPAGTTAYAGLALGFVVRFTNGLTAYLTGDTGIFGDMGQVIAKFYHPNLVVMNLGPGGNGPTSLGAEDAANAIVYLVRPATVMPSHPGEQASAGGVVRANTRTEKFVRAVKDFTNVVLPLSDVELGFDGDGRCVGCPR
jgi:L-ascorbate metabolism protein UlaG (beta-lactamase superfamily)